MKNTVVCPACGEVNQADEEFCTNCQTRLRPLPPPIGDDRPSNNAGTPTDADADIPQWLREARQKADKESPATSSKSGVPKGTARLSIEEDYLAGLQAQNEPADDETPAWVARITGLTSDSEEPARPASQDRGYGGAQQAPSPSEDYAEAEEDSAGWRPVPGDGLASESVGPFVDGAPEDTEGLKPAPADDNEVYDWLRKLDAANAATDDTPAAEAMAVDVPDWVRNLGPQSSTPDAGPLEGQGEAVPDWLQTAGLPEEEAPEDRFRVLPPEEGIPSEPISPAAEPEQAPAVFDEVAPAGGEPTHAQPPTSAAPFTSDSLAGDDVAAIFASMQMPDWLSDVTPADRPLEADLPPAAEEQDSIGPAELPSWVQAMRPVESALGSVESASGDLPLEERGPLLGLHGVLPSVPGAAVPSSKPGPHSLKIDITDQQQTHAALLEGILGAESTPIPMKAAAVPTAQRVLRWAISAALFFVLGAALFSGSQVFPLPNAVPNETISAIQAVQNIPEGAPVLAVFDYEPATMGEMEATSASLMDHLLLLKHPRLALISTSPTGSVLAERFMATALAERNYQRGAQYIDLGFLPGGLTGVYAFAQDPLQAAPLAADATRAWNSPVLTGVQRLSDFSAIIVLTDSLESARAWIEQTSLHRSPGSLIVVSSAQVGPMLLPYVDSGQVTGLVSGVNGAVGTEQANGGLPGYVRKYWDAYSLGTYLAAVLMALGGAWYLWLGIRERRMQEI